MTAQAKKPPYKPAKPRSNRRVDVTKAIALKNQGLTYQEIAKLQGVCKQAIHQSISHLMPTIETETYKSNRADILAQLQLRILDSIDSDDIKKSPFGSRVLAYAQLYDKERIERGGSSEGKPMVIINRISINTSAQVERNEQDKVIDVSSGNTIECED